VRIDGLVALETLASEQQRAFFPEQADARTRDGTLFPEIRPSFSFDRGSRIFTIGSCFARNIEEHLVVRTTRGFEDLLVVGGVDKSQERAFERRREIDEIYMELPRSDVVIVTLGMVEAWVDNRSGTYLNRLPPTRKIRKNPRQYGVEIMDVRKAQSLLERALRLLTDRGIKVVLLVSAVPLRAMFSGEDVVVANSYSKSVLRVCAQRVAANPPGVDYFPAYEIVTSGGPESYEEDQRHVVDDVVSKLVRFMLERYEAPSAAVGGGNGALAYGPA
jgi:hypothetical protein